MQRNEETSREKKVNHRLANYYISGQ